MRRMIAGLALASALVLPMPAASFEAPEPQSFALEDPDVREAVRYVRAATGRLVISPDGTPTDIEINAGEPRIEALYRRIIGAWRFAPVERDGKPVALPVDMNLTLTLDRIEGTARQARYGVADVLFLESTSDDAVGLVTSDFRPPAFPLNMARAGLGALVTVLVEVNEDGRVVRAAVADADLYARQTTSSRAAAAQVERFAGATLAVVGDWVFGDPGVIEEGWALVPVNFALPGATPLHWTPVLPMRVSRHAWMEAPLAEAKATSGSGRAEVDDVRLLTPLSPAPN